MEEDMGSLFSLQNRVALVTGASQGIGKEIALAYSRAGARLVICSREKKRIDKVGKEIKESGGEVLSLEANVSNAEDRERLVKSAVGWGGKVDILVNNAGANPVFGPLADISESAWDKVFEVNLKATFFISQLVYHASMKESGGVILNVSSIAGLKTTKGINVYNVAKAALIHLTRCLASEWGHNGIRVNALALGIIKTQFSRAIWEGPHREELFNSFPIPRIGEVDDVAGGALFLISPAASYITGHILTIDGGQLVK